jgi:uncharacterized protein
MTLATISGLFVYPVKSAHGIARERVRIAATGFEWDRQWMLVDGNGLFLSQRTHPQLACIVPEVLDEALVLSAPQRPPLRVPLRGDGPRVNVRVHRDPCIGLDQGGEAAAWLSSIAHQPVRLVRVPDDPQRRANPHYTNDLSAPMGFADGYPILVCNEASLRDLNTHMPQAVPMNRFRPNIVLEGLPPWAEDRIASLAIGRLTLRLVKPCERCTIPRVDQESGLPSTDPAPVLKRFRFDKTLLGVLFGENAVVAEGQGTELVRGALCHVSYEPAPAG